MVFTTMNNDFNLTDFTGLGELFPFKRGKQTQGEEVVQMI